MISAGPNPKFNKTIGEIMAGRTVKHKARRIKPTVLAIFFSSHLKQNLVRWPQLRTCKHKNVTCICALLPSDGQRVQNEMRDKQCIPWGVGSDFFDCTSKGSHEWDRNQFECTSTYRLSQTSPFTLGDEVAFCMRYFLNLLEYSIRLTHLPRRVCSVQKQWPS